MGPTKHFVNLMKVAFNESLNWETSKKGPNPEASKVLNRTQTDVGRLAHAS